MAARILVCGDMEWAGEKMKEMFANLAETIILDSGTRDDFFTQMRPGGKYENITAIYHQNSCMKKVGPWNRELIEAMPSTVKWIAHKGAGYDMIDVQACKDRGIGVSNTPGTVDDATATTALFLMISAFRNFSTAERNLRAGNWKNGLASADANGLTGRTLAILGLGGIGYRMAELVQTFPMRIIYHSRHPVAKAPSSWEYFGPERMDEFLANADVLSIHVPLNDETRGMVGEDMIRKLKRGAIIVNTARGKVIDEEALIRALEDRHLGAVGLDVFATEPSVDHRIIGLPNATLLPHVGTLAQDCMLEMEVRALINIQDYLGKGVGRDIVPELDG